MKPTDNSGIEIGVAAFLTPAAEEFRHFSQLVSSRWTLLILACAFTGITRFVDFRDTLSISTDVLAARPGALVDTGILERRPYGFAATRTRTDYLLTPEGKELAPVIVRLEEWWTAHRRGGKVGTP